MDNTDRKDDLEWKTEYDELLEEVASTDHVDVSKWPLLRDIIRYKIDKNIALFLSGTVKKEYSRLTVTATPCPGGLKLPPFPPREQARVLSSAIEAPKNQLTEQEASDYKATLYSMLNEFHKSPPFTIQRLSELCLRPTEQYKYLGKYLRAVERSLLVTSTWDAFPPIPEGATPRAVRTVPLAVSSLSAPSTPLFSPIPFLHEDARRSSSRSPPPSPLVLPAIRVGGTATAMPSAGAEGAGQKALGLVDELDHPSPGHLSEQPQPISATTTVNPQPKPLFGSLEERFVAAAKQVDGDSEEMKTDG
ncbi:uncharacterized protein LAESUDRAFT_756437 [Laetiporus sulphureus 93-53]|uniref:PPP4R2-domain-containing protein n=1 Tax=Laetiporus sulphureus 93-53 TaxID=1314785 RepID=A0A165FVU4_9APHY|nr:uncharacterized protein LAESUDRAFT_756437 [Laetiporus sulphureus 93-53]KZT09477.1 hypothetical protein LAESUDRAFT_756437 [Laetiporus sulphureus 93-53]